MVWEGETLLKMLGNLKAKGARHRERGCPPDRGALGRELRGLPGFAKRNGTGQWRKAILETCERIFLPTGSEAYLRTCVEQGSISLGKHVTKSHPVCC